MSDEIEFSEDTIEVKPKLTQKERAKEYRKSIYQKNKEKLRLIKQAQRASGDSSSKKNVDPRMETHREKAREYRRKMYDIQKIRRKVAQQQAKQAAREEELRQRAEETEKRYQELMKDVKPASKMERHLRLVKDRD